MQGVVANESGEDKPNATSPYAQIDAVLSAAALSRGLARTRAFNTALLATAYAEIDLEQALGAGAEALAMTAGLQSGRAVRYVDDLRRRLRWRYGNEPGVRDFDELANETLGSR